MNMQRERSSRRAALIVATVMGAGIVAGCEVVNPGPVDDQYIALPASQAGLVNGSWERMNRLIGTGSYNEAIPAREIFHGGQTGSYGHAAAAQAGNMGGWTAAGPYNNAQQARWIAEEAIRQFEARDDVSAEMLTRAYLAAGYANRVNGDYFCWGAIDSGPLVPGSHYWERAEGHFTKALAVAEDGASRTAAYAGRAQARLSLEDWAGAKADAAQVPTDFVFEVVMDFSRSGTTAQRNHVYWANADSPFRSYSIRHTFFDEYYKQTGDPRTPWRFFPSPSAQFCVGALAGYGAVPCTQQQKYTGQDDNIRLASGSEMRLVEAETILRMTPGNWQAAMTIINANRTSYSTNSTADIGGTHPGGTRLAPWVANNLDDAWTYLMRERGIELWLEARRFADMRRWEPLIIEYGTFDTDGQTVLEIAKTTPGTLDWPRYEDVMLNPNSNLFTTTLRGRPSIRNQSLPRELCYNISDTERLNNPNMQQQDDDITP